MALLIGLCKHRCFDGSSVVIKVSNATRTEKKSEREREEEEYFRLLTENGGNKNVRTNSVDTNALVCYFLCCAFSQADDAVLRHNVGRHGRKSKKAGYAGNIHDAAFVFNQRHLGAEAIKHAVQIDAQNRVPVMVGQLGDWLAVSDNAWA